VGHLDVTIGTNALRVSQEVSSTDFDWVWSGILETSYFSAVPNNSWTVPNIVAHLS
jgi:hypothetical protein